jgi:hypothetical protein
VKWVIRKHKVNNATKQQRRTINKRTLKQKQQRALSLTHAFLKAIERATGGHFGGELTKLFPQRVERAC